MQNRLQITYAMRLLHAGVDTSVIALWLGHAHVDTTQIYLEPQELHQMGEPNASSIRPRRCFPTVAAAS